jgi:hypothetical protein
MLVGAFTSAAWIAPRPWCWVLQFLAAALFIAIKMVP